MPVSNVYAAAGSPLARRATIPPSSTPTSSVGQFATQQLGSLLSGRIAGQTPFNPTQTALDGSRAQSTVQLAANKRLDSVRLSSQRLSDIVKVGEQKQQAAQKVAAKGVASVGGNMQQAGKAWKPDGSLSDSRNFALTEASKYLGSRYVLGGTSTKGIDCSGLVMMVYNKLGYKLNHSATAQGKSIPGVRTSINNLRPGDIVAWKDGSHIAIYAGNGEIIEAANPTRGTLRRKIWANPGAVYGIALRLPGE